MLKKQRKYIDVEFILKFGIYPYNLSFFINLGVCYCFVLNSVCYIKYFVNAETKDG